MNLEEPSYDKYALHAFGKKTKFLEIFGLNQIKRFLILILFFN